MPRSARLDLPDLLQHVIVRGVERCDIFRDDNDRLRFLQSFSKLLVETDTECFAWSLMTNHFHLLLRPQNRLAPFMRRLLTGYAIYFNLRHKRYGHLFQNRYKSIVCEEDSYLLELVRYIHLNPLRAGLVEDLAALDHYAWSGHAVILGKSSQEGQVADEVLSLFSEKRGEARRRYRAFVADGVSQEKREKLGGGRKKPRRISEEEDGALYDKRVLGSAAFVQELRKRQDLESEFPRPMEIAEIIARVCRHFGIEPEELRLKSRVGRLVAARNIICYFAVRQVGHNGVDVGRHVNLRRAGVSVAAGRGAEMVKNDPVLFALLNN
ncbi:MAG: transposase [Deltaproteobacteria bacterium]|nr:transposase [Deltaproteobacteria bacterium]